jgi:predicted N-acetyltransferase YhbS
MSTSSMAIDQNLRPLQPDDAEKIIAIDRAHSGHSRRSFFEKRLAAANAHPNDFIHIGVTRNDALYGFAMARILRGEFGREYSIAVLDGLGVETENRERGVGKALMDGLTQDMRRMGVQSLQSQAVWTNDGLLRFFAAAGFELAPRHALERLVVAPLNEVQEDV